MALAIVADFAILAFLLLRVRRTWIKATFATLALAFLVMAAAYGGTADGVLTPAWEAAILWGLVLAHPLTAILVLSLIHGETVPRRRPAAFLLLVPVPILAGLAPFGGWTLAQAYDLNPLGAFLVFCLAVALGEAVYARISSALLRTEAFWLSLGLIAFVVAGPVYSYELAVLGLPTAAGLAIATPFILASFAIVASHADPFPTPFQAPHRRWQGETSVGDGLVFVFEETRPKYASLTMRTEARRGRPVLILARSTSGPVHPDDRPLTSVLERSPGAALRTLATAAEFLVRAPGGIVLLRDLADVVALSGWPRARELVVDLGRVCRDTGSTLLVSTSRLTAAERDDLRSLRYSWWTLPDPADEVEAVLAESFGTGANRLVASFGRAHGLRREDLTTDHVDALAAFLRDAVEGLARDATDHKATSGLREQTAKAAQALRAFGSRTAVDLAGGDWPSKRAKASDADLLVTAADYWKGKETEELFAAADALVEREPLFERARSVFVDHLGAAGETVLRSELAHLGKRPEELRPEDLVRLADRAAVDLASMADVVDIPQEKDRIHGQVESLRRRLLTISGEDA